MRAPTSCNKFMINVTLQRKVNQTCDKFLDKYVVVYYRNTRGAKYDREHRN